VRRPRRLARLPAGNANPSAAGTIQKQTAADGIAIPAPTHQAGAGHLPDAHPHVLVLQACRAERRDQTDSTAPDIGTTRAEMEEGWNKVERKRGKGNREKKVGPGLLAASRPGPI
jgi:hypothetical protein